MFYLFQALLIGFVALYFFVTFFWPIMLVRDMKKSDSEMNFSDGSLLAHAVVMNMIVFLVVFSCASNWAKRFEFPSSLIAIIQIIIGNFLVFLMYKGLFLFFSNYTRTKKIVGFGIFFAGWSLFNLFLVQSFWSIGLDLGSL